EAGVLEQAGQLVAGHRIDPPAYRLAGEKAAEPGGEAPGGPHVEVVAEDARPPQIQVPLAPQAGPPVVGHLGDGLRRTGEGAPQGVLDAAVDHPLAGQGLVAAEGFALQQDGVVALPEQVVEGPKSRDTTADDGDVDGERTALHGA